MNKNEVMITPGFNHCIGEISGFMPSPLQVPNPTKRHLC